MAHHIRSQISTAHSGFLCYVFFIVRFEINRASLNFCLSKKSVKLNSQLNYHRFYYTILTTNPNKDAIVNLIDGLSVCQLCVCIKNAHISMNVNGHFGNSKAGKRQKERERETNYTHFPLLSHHYHFVEAAANGVADMAGESLHLLLLLLSLITINSLTALFGCCCPCFVMHTSWWWCSVILLQQFSGCKYVIRQHITSSAYVL